MEYLKFLFYSLLTVATLAGWIIPMLLFEEGKKKLGWVCTIIYFIIATFGLFTFWNSLPGDVKSRQYTRNGTYYETREDYCAYRCRYMLSDLSDTWGNNINNQDAISKTIMECYEKCLNNK